MKPDTTRKGSDKVRHLVHLAKHLRPPSTRPGDQWGRDLSPHLGQRAWTPSHRLSSWWRTGKTCRSAAPGETATAGWGRCLQDRWKVQRRWGSILLCSWVQLRNVRQRKDKESDPTETNEALISLCTMLHHFFENMSSKYKDQRNCQWINVKHLYSADFYHVYNVSNTHTNYLHHVWGATK